MVKKIVLSIAFICGIWVKNYAQESKGINDTIKKYANNQVKKLVGIRQNRDALSIEIYTNFKQIQDLLKEKDLVKDSTAATLKKLYVKNIEMLQLYVFMRTAEFDSIIHYNTITKQYTEDPYMLARSASFTSYAYEVKSDYTNQILFLKEAIKYFSESNHVEAIYRKTQVLIELFTIYNNYDLMVMAENLIPIVEKSLNDLKADEENRGVKNSQIYKNCFFSFTLKRCNLMLYNHQKKEVLSILKEFDTVNFSKMPGSYSLTMASSIHALYKKLEKPRKSLQYLDMIYKSDKFRNMTNIVDLKLNLLNYANIYASLNEKNKANEYFKKYIKDTIPDGYSKLIVQDELFKYYDQVNNKEALKHLKRATFLRDSIYKSGFLIANQIYAKELNIEKEIIEIKKKNFQKELVAEKEANILKLMIAICLLICFIILVAFYFYTKKKSFQKKLELEKTKEILNYKNNFLENISHEMRTPITIIIGYVSLIKSKVLEPKKVIHYADVVLESSHHTIKNLNNFLTISKLEHLGNHQIGIQLKNMHAFFIDLMHSFSVTANLKKIKLSYETNIAENASINFAYDHVQKITENLITNALKYSSSNTTVSVNLSLSKDSFVIAVKDQGIGITIEDQQHLFTKFYQSKQHSVTGGFGIGLALVNELVKELNGSIEVSSEPNVGSIFTVALPHQLPNYKIFVSNTTKEFMLLTTEDDDTIASSNLPKILLVDDDVAMILYYQELLSDSLQCYVAFNGKEALEIVKNNTIDIIISDYRMPIIDGMDFKNALNENEDYKNIPFIMVSAVALNFTDDPRMTLGVDDYIVKPFDKNEIMAKIISLLENKMYTKKILSTNQKDVPTYNHVYTELLEKVNTIILNNLSNTELDAETLAAECGYTQRNLNKILQKTIGLTLVKVVLEIRLQKAYEFIVANTYSTLEQIMFETGFNSRPYFYKKFKERFGIKPGDLKKKYF